jgi:OTU domain-containing protein 6
MEELQRKQRQEQKDLQSRITQKKKSATKKTRKGVNDECSELERQLRERHEQELSVLTSQESTECNGDLLSDDTEESNFQATSKDINDSINSLSVSTPAASVGHARKPNRQKARLARRAAEQEAAAEQVQEEAAHLPNLREQELKSMREAYTSRGLKEHEIRSDGHCLYAAVADQLEDAKLGLEPKIVIEPFQDDSGLLPKSAGYKVARQVAAGYISQNPNDYVPFLEEPLDGYVKTIRETGEWGGHLEILALAKAYEVDINVLRGDGQVDKIECGSGKAPSQLWLAYYRHSFGLGEHYNSLRGAH